MPKLTSRQTEAIHHYTGPAIVVAGPGSGKTRVLIERIRFLIEEKNVLPENILAVTFTEKAAEEMSTRLHSTIGDKAQKVHISTFHSFCKRIMEDNFMFHELGASFNVLDAEDQKLFVMAYKSKLDISGIKGWRDIIIKAAGFMGNPEDQVCLLYNIMTENSIDSAALAAALTRKGSTLGVYEDDAQKLVSSYDKYCDLLREEKLVDFAHLESTALDMLKNKPEVLEAVRKQFQFVLVDEYQDTSPIQDELISHVVSGHKNVFVVGDENQSIYGFRGAVKENFSKFDKSYPSTSEYRLSTNFRSFGTIVDTANKLLESKIREKLKAHRAKGNDIILITGDNRRAVAKNAAAFLKKRIKQGTLSIGDTAFLYRKKSLADEVIASLTEEGLPFVTDNDGRFLDRSEIRGIINIFAYLHQDAGEETRFKDWSDWWRPDLFDNEVIGFSKKTLAALEKLPRNASLKDITKEEKAKVIGITGSADTRKLCNLNLLRAKIEDKKKGLLDSLYEIFRITGYISQLMAKPSVENEEKLYNIAQLTGLFDRYERRFSRPSAKSLLWLLYKKTMDKGMDQVITTGENAAKCMTVHKAKGLEFPAVVVCSCIEGDFPLRYRARETICGIPIPPDMLKSKEPDMDEHLEEELRLFYVAITRAQDLLVITVPDKINVRKAKRSSFVKMIEEYVTETVDSDITMEKKYKQPKPVTTLSYSAVHAYKDCPFRYKINYVYGFVSPTEPMQRLGIIIHNVLQKVNWALQNDRNVTGEILKKFMEESWLPIAGKKTEENFRKQVFEHIKDYIAFARKEFKRIQCFEKPFTHIDGSLIMRGKVDLVAEDKSGKNVLVDFKAMKKEGIKKTGVEDQLGIYRHCLMDMKIDRMATYTFYDNQFTDFTYDEKATKRLLSDVTSGLLKESFPMKKDKTDCDACPYQFICAELPNG